MDYIKYTNKENKRIELLSEGDDIIEIIDGVKTELSQMFSLYDVFDDVKEGTKIETNNKEMLKELSEEYGLDIFLKNKKRK